MTARQLPLVYMLLASTGRAGDLRSHTIPEATDCTVCIAYSMDLWHYRKYSTHALTSPAPHLRVVFCTVTLHTCPTASGWAVYTTACHGDSSGSTLSATDASSENTRATFPNIKRSGSRGPASDTRRHYKLRSHFNKISLLYRSKEGVVGARENVIIQLL